VLKRIYAVEALRSEASDGAPFVTAQPLLNDYGGIEREITADRKGIFPFPFNVCILSRRCGFP
jgi:hypothetical protein